MDRWKVEKKNLFMELFMGILGSGCAVLISPIMMRLAVGQKENVMMITVGVAACLFGVWILTVFLFHEKRTAAGCTDSSQWRKAIKGSVLVAVIFLAMLLLISFLNGALTVLLYPMLKSTLDLEEIKGVFNYTAGAMTVLAVPAFLSLFWTIAEGGRLMRADRKGKHRYVRLLILSLLLFAAGMVITTACNHITSAAISQAVAMTLFAVTGFAGLAVSEQICRG